MKFKGFGFREEWKNNHQAWKVKFNTPTFAKQQITTMYQLN